MDCTPYEIAAAFHDEDGFAFLDSSRNDADQGRYSILAWRPQSVLRMRGENPLPAIDRFLRSNPKGGVIGYFSYDLFRYLEQYKDLKAVDDLGLPDCCLMAYDRVLVFDHQRQKWTGTVEFRAAKPAACRIGEAAGEMTREQYVAGVEKALEYIAAG